MILAESKKRIYFYEKVKSQRIANQFVIDVGHDILGLMGILHGVAILTPDEIFFVQFEVKTDKMEE